MTARKLPLEFFTGRLNERKPFAFVRMGDGEFSALLGKQGATCDGQPYSAQLADDLKWTITEPRVGDYFYALGPRAWRLLGKEIAAFQRENHVNVCWYDSETFLEESLAGKLAPLVNALRDRRVMMVAPAYVLELPMRFSNFVPVPLHDAYAAKERLRHEILDEAYLVDTILFSAGPVAKVLIWELFPHLGQTHFLLDCGSLWDVFCGVDSRGYARRMSAEEKARLREANFGNDMGAKG